MRKKIITILLAAVVIAIAVTVAYADPPYTVTFLDWNGSVIDVRFVNLHNGAVTPPDDPIRVGYTFTTWDKFLSVVNADMTVQAKYEPIRYTITYDLGAGGVTAIGVGNPTSYTIEDTPLYFYPPSRQEFSPPVMYACIGWEEGFCIPAGSTGNWTMTAKWIRNQCKYVEFEDGDYRIMVGRTDNGNGNGQYFMVVKDKDGRIIDSAINLNGPSGTTSFPFTFTGAGYSIEAVLRIHGNDLVGVDSHNFKKVPVRYSPGAYGNFPLTTYSCAIGAATPPPPAGYDVPRVPGYVFAGWIDEYGNPPTPTVTRGVTYTAVWLPDSGLSYRVEYRDGTTGDRLLDDKVVPNRTFDVVYTEFAPHINGYRPDAPTKTIRITANNSNNVLVFTYMPYDEIHYIVEYRLGSDTGIELAPYKESGPVEAGDTFTETPKIIPGYIPRETSMDILVSSSGPNVFIFVYDPRSDLRYKVKYLEAVTGVNLFPVKIVNTAEFNKLYTEYPQIHLGYDVTPAIHFFQKTLADQVFVFIYTPRTDLYYTVEYRKLTVDGPRLLDDKRVNDRTYKETYREDAEPIFGYTWDADYKEITIGTTENIIRFIYTPRDDLKYTVEYREAGTNIKLHPDKFVDNAVMDEEVTEYYVTIPGYTPVVESKTVLINDDNMTIVLYYNSTIIYDPAKLTIEKDVYNIDGFLINNSITQKFHVIIYTENGNYKKHLYLEPGKRIELNVPKRPLLIREDQDETIDEYTLAEIISFNSFERVERLAADNPSGELIGAIDLSASASGNVSVINIKKYDDIPKPRYDNIWLTKYVYEYGLLVESDDTLFTIRLASEGKTETVATTHNAPPVKFTALINTEYTITEAPTPPGTRYELIGIYDNDNPDVNEGDRSNLKVTLAAGSNNGKSVLVLNARVSLYKVLFDTQGGSLVPEKTGVRWADKNLLPAANPTKSGYKFDGWYTEANGGEQVTNATAYSALAGGIVTKMEVIIYAKWVADESKPTPTPSPSTRPTSTSGPGPGPGPTSKPTPTPTIIIIPSPTTPLGPFDPPLTFDHIQYINGYPDGSVRPDASITRAETCAILFRLIVDSKKSNSFVSPFSDVADGAWYAQSVKYLASMNIVHGYPEGDFRPDNPITRAEFAVMISGFDKLAISDKNKYPDIDGHWAVGYINSAAEKGWINGYPDKSFRPDNFLTRAEIVTVINRMLKRFVKAADLPNWIPNYNDIDDTHWAYSAIMEASVGHEFERKADGIYETWTKKMSWIPVLES